MKGREGAEIGCNFRHAIAAQSLDQPHGGTGARCSRREAVEKTYQTGTNPTSQPVAGREASLLAPCVGIEGRPGRPSIRPSVSRLALRLDAGTLNWAGGGGDNGVGSSRRLGRNSELLGLCHMELSFVGSASTESRGPPEGAVCQEQ
ncbi:hypothetical protein MPTK1_7g06890 [Marchantia polymorpha subsp. ruderalis]|uniref:Uncharacterized protein n=2 Tax=Marchantia polymorpha TaxID=3197 RepID=A0A176WC40_MARPO|nr:hypothetical protein AXG93_1527s1010 [Marchantia polymorpha subsp. ruderalis]PTQ27413.1 hypothetical protein MARPO_0199s0003 [Marchantia polymorpha]BBN16503.1 hypothetical protein Mp_7g06890 [Marchantia polymorpha subsp. ruderalis]|eukprot:PTQ27413.1 hypothetical protein MARPO_0199s0003 [Marchantia polymorpha]